MKIYTKTGDKGTTGYIGGRLRKDSSLILCVGELDELNATLGVTRHLLTRDSSLISSLAHIQQTLLEIGSIAANPQLPERKQQVLRSLLRKNTRELEKEIDRLTSELPELRNFILPGGSQAGSHLHLARAVCRRAERSWTSLLTQPPVVYSNMDLVEQGSVYLNRLSDWLFTAARWENHHGKHFEEIWNPAS